MSKQIKSDDFDEVETSTVNVDFAKILTLPKAKLQNFIKF